MPWRCCSASSFFVLLGAAFLCLVAFLPIRSYFLPWACEMTWMYQHPHYQLVSVDERYPHYSLHLYRESKSRTQIKSFQLGRGQPVLFIPGNSGSHKQVRSAASVALRMHTPEYPRHREFDFFTVNLNEELSGLYGGVLESQLEFVAVSIEHILSLYKGHSPEPMVLIGHSMGGVVARGLVTLPGFNISSLATIITLASPLKRPVLACDSQLQYFYKSIEEVRMCRRVQLALVRALFTIQGMPSPRERRGVLQHFLLSGKEVPMAAHPSLSTAAKLKRWEAFEGEYLWRNCSEEKCLSVVMDLSLWGRGSVLTVASNTAMEAWVYACSNNFTQRNGSCTDLSFMARILPPNYSVMKLLVLASVEQLPSGATHLVVSKPLSGEVKKRPGNATDMYMLVERCGNARMVLDLPKWGSSLLLLPPHQHCTLTNFSLPGLTELWQVYQVDISSSSCAGLGRRELRVGLQADWYPQGSSLHSAGPSVLYTLSLLVSPPASEQSQYAHLMVWAHRECEVKVAVSFDVFGVLNKLAILYTPLLLPWVIVAAVSSESLVHISALVLALSVMSATASTSASWLCTDWHVLMEERLWFPWTPHLLCTVAFGIWELVRLGLSCALRQVGAPSRQRWCRWVSCALVPVAWGCLCVCSGLGVWVATCAHLLQAKSTSKDCRVCGVVLCGALVFVPALLSWGRQPTSLLMFGDPQLLPALSLMLPLTLLSLLTKPPPPPAIPNNNTQTQTLSHLLLPCAAHRALLPCLQLLWCASLLLWCTVGIHLVPYHLSVYLLAVWTLN